MTDDNAADIAALKDALENAVTRTRMLCEQDPHEFGEAYARVELARRAFNEAARRYQHKAENRQKMALLRDLTALRR